MRRCLAIVGVTVLLLSWGPAAAGALGQEDRGSALVRFQQAVDAYMELHERVERALPPLRVTPDMEQIAAATAAMAEGMRAARPAPVEGEIFNAEIAAILRQTLPALVPRAERDRDVLLFGDDEEERPTLWRPLIHDEFDWTEGTSMSPLVLMALPPLPEELQFRFVGRDLVIVDLHSNLIVDVLPDVLPACGSPRGMLSTTHTGTSHASADGLALPWG
jgi:hypothetical protein